MRKPILLLSLLLSVNLAPPAFSQSGTVSGLVIDSITGQPVAGMAVFIPSTTKGTTTDSNGNYSLNRIPPGDYIVTFRHMSYLPYSKSITIEPGRQMVLNASVSLKTHDIKEVVITGKIPDWSWGYNLFKEYFLGDPSEMKCFVRNPKDLRFVFQGEILTAYSRKPLEIINRHLGYRITYYIDYFKFAENKNPGTNTVKGSYYAFSGSALYQNLPSGIPLSAVNWKYNRESEFRGSLRHFLASLYQDKLAENGYAIRKSYSGLTDFQDKEKLSQAMAKIYMAGADSVFAWYPEKDESGYLYYIPAEEFPIPADSIPDGPWPGEKNIRLHEPLLVFKDLYQTPELHDDWISALRAPSGTIVFDREGNCRVLDGSMEWTILDNSMRMKVMLPTDYLPGKPMRKNSE